MILHWACFRPSSSLARRCATFSNYSNSFFQQPRGRPPLRIPASPRILRASPTPRRGENMTAATLVAPISLSNDLLTGAEWSPARTRELLQLSTDIKARPGPYPPTRQGKFIPLVFQTPSPRP